MDNLMIVRQNNEKNGTWDILDLSLEIQNLFGLRWRGHCDEPDTAAQC